MERGKQRFGGWRSSLWNVLLYIGRPRGILEGNRGGKSPGTRRKEIASGTKEGPGLRADVARARGHSGLV